MSLLVTVSFVVLHILGLSSRGVLTAPSIDTLFDWRQFSSSVSAGSGSTSPHLERKYLIVLKNATVVAVTEARRRLCIEEATDELRDEHAFDNGGGHSSNTSTTNIDTGSAPRW